MNKIIFLVLITTILGCQEKKQGKLDNYKDIQVQRIDYIVTNYEIKDINYDSLAIKENIKLSFYRSNDTLYFMNQWEKSHSKSFGEVLSITKRSIRKTKEAPRKEEYEFIWSFKNSYDDIKGKANVTFTEIFNDSIVNFTTKIQVLNSDQSFVIKGYLDAGNNIVSNLKLSDLYELSKSEFTAVTEEYTPEYIEAEEFENFKEKSDYINTIEAYDKKNYKKYTGLNTKDIRFNDVPTEINVQNYLNNSILFGDLNGDNKRDCIVSVFRSDNYNEITYFYVFINYGTYFKLEDVQSEDDICGCMNEGWPSLFRYQKIEDGYLKGISMCHYKDAHCCPSIYFKTKVEFKNGKLQFNSAEFFLDDATKYRPTPTIDSVLVKK